MKQIFSFAAIAAVALSSYAGNPFAGTYLMNTESDMGTTSTSVVTVSDSNEPDEVEIRGLVNATSFKGTIIKAVTDEAAGTMTFAAGQPGFYYESPVSLTLFKEGDGDLEPVDGSVVAKRTSDGGFAIDGTWGFVYSDNNEIAFVVTSAELVLPNATFDYSYRHSSNKSLGGKEPLRLAYENDRLTISGFSPEVTDPLNDMVFIVDREKRTASLADPETPNASGWTGDRYLCTITSFSGNFQNPNLGFAKGIECRIENGNTLVFPDKWGIVTINPNDGNVEPGINGYYTGGRLECDFDLCSPAGIETVSVDADSSETRYYDLTGRPLQHPAGLCIAVKGGKAYKVIFPAAR